MVKQLLRHAEAAKDDIFTQTRTVIFLSTPHAGATIATIGSHLGTGVGFLGGAAAKFLPGPIGAIAGVAAQVAAWSVRVSDLTSQLRKEEPSLLELNRWYRTVTHIDTRVYYETEAFYHVLVVDPLSADPGVYRCAPVPVEHKDHITISKPKNEDDYLFKAVAAIVEEVRERELEGKTYPVLREWVHDILRHTQFRQYVGIGRFEDIPTSDRSDVEFEIRDQFRERIKAGITFDVEAAKKIQVQHRSVRSLAFSGAAGTGPARIGDRGHISDRR
jgi:hypothetical protein